MTRGDLGMGRKEFGSLMCRVALVNCRARRDLQGGRGDGDGECEFPVRRDGWFSTKV